MFRTIGRAAALLGLMLAAPAAALAEANTIRIAKQYGLGYIQFMIMEEQKLVEKHAKAAGLGDVQVTWGTFRSSDVMNDALISGNLDFACLGPPGLATIWSRTRGNIDVRIAAGLNMLPLILTTRDPSVKSIRDFKENHKIAIPAAKVSIQAILLQMASVREWGEGQYGKLDPLTMSLAHPDATAMMLAGGTEINANFSSAPFQYRQLKQPGIHQVTTSEEITGGGYSFNVIATTGKFRSANPKLYGAFLSALQEATDFVNKDKNAATDVYIKVSGDKTPKAEILEIMNKPEIKFTTEVVNVGIFTDFMGKVGTLKNPPKDWKTELVFPEAKVR